MPMSEPASIVSSASSVSMYPLKFFLRPDYPIQACSDNADYENNEDGCNVPQVDQGASAREDLDINGPHRASLLGLSAKQE